MTLNLLVGFSLFHVCLVCAKEVPRYYLGIDSILWDYYSHSDGKDSLHVNRCTGKAFDAEELLYLGQKNATGELKYLLKYKKLVFREYTDETFTKIKERRYEDLHLGLLGPTFRVESGEKLSLVLRGVKGNHGVNVKLRLDELQTKENDIIVRPNQKINIEFNVVEEQAPTEKSYVDSRLVLYKGIIVSGSNEYSGLDRGLLGGCIIYRKGMLDSNRNPYGVSSELITIFWIIEENNVSSLSTKESNLKYSINGRLFCSLNNLTMYKEERSLWYFGAVGTEKGVHTAHVHGLVLLDSSGAHTDTIQMLPGITVASILVPDNPGIWRLHCHVNNHAVFGMIALVSVIDRNNSIMEPDTMEGFERKYFLQAEDVIWDYAPAKKNMCEKRELDGGESLYVKNSFPISLDDGRVGYTLGSSYLKTVFVEYRDEYFNETVKRNNEEEHMGFMGPVLRAKVGETMIIFLKNKSRNPVSIHPHGLFYSKENEGASYLDNTTGKEKADDRLESGESYTYRWKIPSRSGPGPGERTKKKVWIYHSHVNEIGDSNAGLIGMILIFENSINYNRKTLRPLNGERELFLYFSLVNEQQSINWDENRNIEKRNQRSFEFLNKLESNSEFQESNIMHSINGFVFCNGPLINLKLKKLINVYFFSLGTDLDIHTLQMGDEILQLDILKNRASWPILSGSFYSALVTPQNSGFNYINCAVTDHTISGMRTLYNASEGEFTSKELDFDLVIYIAAEEVVWNYTSSDDDHCFSYKSSNSFSNHKSARTSYLKAVYREYGDGTFTWKKNEKDSYFQGIVGPLLHFEVEETVKIVFRNKSKFSCNIHFPGLQWIEGTRIDEEIGSGGTASYGLRVTKDSGPGTNDFYTVPRTYFSSIDPDRHVDAGLVGVFGVSFKGGLSHSSRKPKSNELVYPLLMNIFRENNSPLFIESKKLFDIRHEDPELHEKHTINGFSKCNNPTLIAKCNSKILFYVFGYGSMNSVHVPSWKGQTILQLWKYKTDARDVQIFPFNAEPVVVFMKQKGNWTIECNVIDHAMEGMKFNFEVV